MHVPGNLFAAACSAQRLAEIVQAIAQTLGEQTLGEQTVVCGLLVTDPAAARPTFRLASVKRARATERAVATCCSSFWQAWPDRRPRWGHSSVSGELPLPL